MASPSGMLCIAMAVVITMPVRCDDIVPTATAIPSGRLCAVSVIIISKPSRSCRARKSSSSCVFGSWEGGVAGPLPKSKATVESEEVVPPNSAPPLCLAVEWGGCVVPEGGVGLDGSERGRAGEAMRRASFATEIQQIGGGPRASGWGAAAACPAPPGQWLDSRWSLRTCRRLVPSVRHLPTTTCCQSRRRYRPPSTPPTHRRHHVRRHLGCTATGRSSTPHQRMTRLAARKSRDQRPRCSARAATHLT
mmetsp:Transcript_29141/g.78165  ORF Transcript_29141/g.78165 Transcript_29141/m.78165 type:complete len:249 (-) Transcript_29141:295-1041(-)